MVLSKAAKLYSRLLRWKNPFQKGAQEASDQYVGKKAKVATLEDVEYARDLKELAEDDRAAVRQFREKKTGVSGVTGKGDRDTFVTDDMTINSGTSLPAVLLALVAGGAAVWWLGTKDRPAVVTTPTPAVVTPLPAVPDSEYQVFFYDKDGNQITVPRIPSELKNGSKAIPPTN